MKNKKPMDILTQKSTNSKSFGKEILPDAGLRKTYREKSKEYHLDMATKIKNIYKNLNPKGLKKIKIAESIASRIYEASYAVENRTVYILSDVTSSIIYSCKIYGIYKWEISHASLMHRLGFYTFYINCFIFKKIYKERA